MPRKSSASNPPTHPSLVSFNLGNRTYQIDPQRQKVYSRFVEIETSRAFEIYSTWRAQSAQA